jgi:hypothetical protein
VGSLVRSRLRVTIHVVDDSPAHTRRPLTCHHCQTPTPGRGTRRRDSVRAMPIMRRLLLATAPATIWKPRGSQRSLHLGAPYFGAAAAPLPRTLCRWKFTDFTIFNPIFASVGKSHGHHGELWGFVSGEYHSWPLATIGFVPWSAFALLTTMPPAPKIGRCWLA